ncbi:MAG: sel1 repeat family protein, partial [Candidatus Dormibacteraeota bacterium]|nr:sel1 repeat family protein [Candidatus Dormibacteraeota bacterium]
GVAEAQFALGRLARSPQEAVRWYSDAAQRGHPEALHELSVLLRQGHGVARDAGASERLSRMAAGTGHVAAMQDLAYMYWSGDGVAADREEAIRWYRRAAELGSPQAQHDLAAALSGTDPTETARWLRRAAEAGHPGAMRRLGLAHRDGRGAPADLLQAARWLIAAQRVGSAESGPELQMVARGLTPEQLHEADRQSGGDGSTAAALLAGHILPPP